MSNTFSFDQCTSFPIGNQVISCLNTFSWLFVNAQGKLRQTCKYYATYNALLEIKEPMLNESFLVKLCEFSQVITVLLGLLLWKSLSLLSYVVVMCYLPFLLWWFICVIESLLHVSLKLWMTLTLSITCKTFFMSPVSFHGFSSLR